MSIYILLRSCHYSIPWLRMVREAKVVKKRSFSESRVLSNVDTPELPKLNVKWYYASDIPKSKPAWYQYKQEKEPKKFIPFSEYDSSRLEKRWCEVLEDKVAAAKNGGESGREKYRVDVNEDKLFQVDLQRLELSPVYWEGPVYEVRRGTWFDSDGCPFPLEVAEAIETGYRAKKPYLFEPRDLDGKERLSKMTKDEIRRFNKEVESELKSSPVLKSEVDDAKDLIYVGNDKAVLFFNKKDAAMFPASFNNSYQVGVIRKFGTSPISLISVSKIQRGHSKDLDESVMDNLTKSPVPSITDYFSSEASQLFNTGENTANKSATGADAEETSQDEADEGTKQNDMMRRALESDFDHEVSRGKAERNIEHLVLCIHGIGQILGHKYESVNFPHSINVLRRTMKKLYENDEFYRRLAHPDAKDVNETLIQTNNKIQVLPISWRHKINFHPERAPESLDDQGEYRLPTLAQINVDGVKPLRNILGDVILDVLLYYEKRYVDQIIKVVIEELNRVYKLYKERNPGFKGKVHIMGHSLGSAIAVDILSAQLTHPPEKPDLSKDLLFDVEDLYCVGSPVGAFTLLKQRNLIPRSSVPTEFDPRDKNQDFISPKCSNIFNLFHPCDPVGYRMEPLIKPRFANMKPEMVPFAVKGINTQIKDLADIGGGIQKRIQQASSWFSGKEKKDSADNLAGALEPKSIDKNPIDDIMATLVTIANKDNDEEAAKKAELENNDLKVLTSANKLGRVDYSLPMGVFDFSLVSALSAHVSYFEDKDTAGFIMRQLLRPARTSVDSKVVSIYN